MGRKLDEDIIRANMDFIYEIVPDDMRERMKSKIPLKDGADEQAEKVLEADGAAEKDKKPREADGAMERIEKPLEADETMEQIEKPLEADGAGMGSTKIHDLDDYDISEKFFEERPVMSKSNLKRGFIRPFWITMNIFLIIILIIFILGYVNLRRQLTGESGSVIEEVKNIITDPDPTILPTYTNTDRPQTTNSPIVVPIIRPTTDTDSPVLAEFGPCNYNYLDDMVFLGDSRTVGLAMSGMISGNATFAESGIGLSSFRKTTFEYNGSEMGILSILARKDPKIVYIALGINNVSYTSISDFIKEYRNFIEDIRNICPNCKIIIQSIIPVGNSQTKKLPDLNNTVIDDNNVALVELCKEFKDVYYLDVASAMKQGDNSLATEYDDGGGLHFKAAAYAVIINYIKNHPIPEYSVRYNAQ